MFLFSGVDISGGKTYTTKRTNRERRTKMDIKLSDHFTYGRLLRFTFPAMIMLVFTSLYCVIDGFFVANFAGATALAAVNFVFPILNILSTFGFLFGAGGSALIAKTLGEGNKEKANQLFSLFVYICGGLGIVFAILGFLILRPLMALLGAEGEMLDQAVLYGYILLPMMPFWNLQYAFQILCVTAEKPKLGLYATLAAGFTNMGLDALFVAGFGWGLYGAAAASALSQFIGGGIPLVYFFRKNSSLLRLGAAKWDGKAALKGLSNGSSELVSGVSGSLTGILYNIQLLHYAGELGVAAYSIMMYVAFIYAGIFIGFVNGSAPIIGYHLGAKNYPELKNMRRKCVTVCAVGSVIMFALAQGLAVPLSKIFAGYDPALFDMTLHGFRIYNLSCLFTGLAILGSSFFTALNNGPISATIALLRTVIYQVGCVLILPLMLGGEGIWYALTASEFLAAITTIVFLICFKKKYNY